VNQLKLAMRQLRLRRGLSTVVILMLALGIGATTAMFSLYHQVLVRPLPVSEPEQLVNLAAPGPKPGGGVRDLGLGNREAQFTYPMFRDLQNAPSGFVGLAAHVDFLANLSFDDRPTSGRGWFVSGSYFDVLNLTPALGRLIGAGDDARVGESAVTVLSYEFWQRGFGGDPNVVGKTLSVNGQGLEIVGVAPAGFRGTNMQVRADVFVPLTMAPIVNSGLSGAQAFESRSAYWLYLFARLAPGVTLDRAAAELNVVYSGILREIEAPRLSPQQVQQLPEGTLDRFLERQIAFSRGDQGQSNLPTTAGRPLTLLLGVTVLVLLIVCVNVANLLLARGAARAGEMATRASLGASRGWLVRQLLTESFVLIAIGGLASLGVAALIVRLITALLPVALTTGLAPELSSTAMLLAAGVSLMTVVVFGLAPAWRVSDANPALAMKVHAARSGGGRAAMRFRGALTTAQIAFSMLLLVLAGLFTKSLMNVARLDLGIDVDSIVSFSVSPRLNAYTPDRLADFYDRLEDALAAQPGVVSVGSSGIPLLGDFALPNAFSVEGFEPAPGANMTAPIGMVGADFFAAIGVPLRAGRVFTDQDTTTAPQVVVVNETFARRFRVTDVGQRLGPTGATNYPYEIVGIVADSKHVSVKGETEPVVYLSRYAVAGGIQAMFYYLRASVAPEALLATIPRVVAEIDPEVPVTNLKTMVTTVQESVYIDRLLSMLSVGFAVLATLLAGIGLYGVLAYNVTQRTRELGLRLALGARPGQVRSMVLMQVGVMAAIGAAVGLVAALALGRVAESVLFGLSGRDPLVLTAATTVLAVVVLAGSWLPARRASKIAPTVALRYE